MKAKKEISFIEWKLEKGEKEGREYVLNLMDDTKRGIGELTEKKRTFKFTRCEFGVLLKSCAEMYFTQMKMEAAAWEKRTENAERKAKNPYIEDFREMVNKLAEDFMEPSLPKYPSYKKLELDMPASKKDFDAYKKIWLKIFDENFKRKGVL
jgi:hypothetical protein